MDFGKQRYAAAEDKHRYKVFGGKGGKIDPKEIIEQE